MRVNARLDEATQQQLDYLTQATGESVSHVVRESVARYYVQVKQAQRKPSKFLAMAGMGDSSKGRDGGGGDVSSNLKAHYLAALERKHGLAPLTPEEAAAVAVKRAKPAKPAADSVCDSSPVRKQARSK